MDSSPLRPSLIPQALQGHQLVVSGIRKLR